jgi:hypothetical protein
MKIDFICRSETQAGSGVIRDTQVHGVEEN